MTTTAAKQRYPLDTTRALADGLVAELAPACERIEISGSIRRKIQEVSDIEIVAIPRFVTIVDLFGGEGPRASVLDELCALLRADGTLGDRLDKNGHPAWGPKFKRTRFQGVPVDLFSVIPPASWGVVLAIRTGPADYSHQLVMHHGQYFRDSKGVRRGGLLPKSMRVRDGQLMDVDVSVWTPEEELFFEAIGEPMPQPWERK